MAFLRNLILARLLTPADMGVAASLAVTLSLLEMLSDVAADKLIVQAPDGDDLRLEGVVHAVQCVRGVVQASFLFLLSWPVAALFKMPEALWAFQLIALAPLIRGFAHLDPSRFFRELRYGPSVLAESVPQVVAVLAAWPLARLIGNYGAALWVVLIQSLVYVVCTHAVAERPYRWALDRDLLRRVSSFGWPLVLNSVLLFGINQGDKAIVGAAYAPAELGVYSVAFMLAAAPVMVLGKLSIAIGLPLLSRVQHEAGQFASRYRLLVQTTGLLAACMAVPMILAGPLMIRVLYGDKYAGAGAYFGLLAAMGALRILRMAPTVAAMARGDNVNALVANVARSIALLGIIATAVQHMSLVWVPAVSVGGEAFALAVSIIRLAHRQQVAMFDSIVTTGAVCVIMCAAGTAAWALVNWSSWAMAAAALVAELLTVIVLVSCFPALRRECVAAAAWVRTRRGVSPIAGL
jgi:O-antigen/teichoic acid export membrane protein